MGSGLVITRDRNKGFFEWMVFAVSIELHKIRSEESLGRGRGSQFAFIDGVAVADCDAKFLPAIKNRDDEAQEVWKEAAGDEGRRMGQVESLQVVMRHGRDERNAETDRERERKGRKLAVVEGRIPD